MIKKNLAWIGYVPLAIVAYGIVDSILLFILPYIVSFIFVILGFDSTPEPYLFELQHDLNEIGLTIQKYITLTIVIFLSHFIAGLAAGFVGAYMCPSHNPKVKSIPITIVLSIIAIFFIYVTWENDYIYRGIVNIISTMVAITICYKVCEEDIKNM